MENGMKGLTGRGSVTLLHIAAGLVGLSCLATANAAPGGEANASASSQGLPNLRLRVEQLESAVGELQSDNPGDLPADIDQRIRDLESDIGELYALNVPVDVDVNCGLGESIKAVLATHAYGQAPLTIHITGTCSEAVAIHRSNVALIGQSGATIQTTPSSAYGITVDNGAANVSVSDLSIVGGAGAAIVRKGAHAVFSNIVAQQSTQGIVSADNGTIDITGSVLRNNTYGAYAVRGGVTSISNSTIESNNFGVYAFKGGAINVTNVLPDGSVGPAGVLVRGNAKGGVARAGGLLELSASRFESNTGEGLLVHKYSSIVFADAANTITGNSYGIFCHPNTSYNLTASSGGVVTGNSFGNIVNCTL
jgi:hypothetical protein